MNGLGSLILHSIAFRLELIIDRLVLAGPHSILASKSDLSIVTRSSYVFQIAACVNMSVASTVQ